MPNSLAATFFACLFLIACADTGQERFDPDTLAESPLEQLWQLGGVNDTTLIFETLTRNDIAVDESDRLFVIDRAASRVAMLDSTGALIRTFGAPGPGPGEFMLPLTIAVAPDGGVHVYDAEKSRIVVFSPMGEFVDETVTTPDWPFRFRFRSDGSMVGSTALLDGGGTKLVSEHDGEWQVLDSIAAGPVGIIESVCNVIGFPVEPVFHPRLAWDARGDTIVDAVGDFAITLRTPRSETRVVRRDTVKAQTTRELALRELGPGRTIQLRGRRPCTVPAEQLLTVATIAPTVPAYTDLTLAREGYLWGTRDVRSDEPTVADVYHLDSGFIHTVTLGRARPALFLRSGVMISIERDADDVPTIVAYRVPADALGGATQPR